MRIKHATLVNGLEFLNNLADTQPAINIPAIPPSSKKEKPPIPAVAVIPFPPS